MLKKSSKKFELNKRLTTHVNFASEPIQTP